MVMLAAIFLSAIFLDAASATFNDEPRHLVSLYTPLLVLAGIFLQRLAALSRFAAATALLAMISTHALFSFTGERTLMHWPEYSTAENRGIITEIGKAPVRNLWLQDAVVSYDLAFELGSEYSVTMRPVADRFPSMRKAVLQAPSFGLLARPHFIEEQVRAAESDGIHCEVISAGPLRLAHSFTRDGRLLTFSEYRESPLWKTPRPR